MKNNRLFLVILMLVVVNSMFAQTTKSTSTKQSFDELWEKASNTKTGDVTKDLNALEKDKIKQIDVKEKNISNPNYNFKKIDTSNLEKFSTQPVIKGVPIKIKNEVEKPKDKIKVETPIVKEQLPVKNVEKITAPIKNAKEKEIPKAVETPVVKKQINTDEFSTQPIIKGKKKETTEQVIEKETPTKKFAIDTTKRLKDFTFETAPVINNNASYNRKNEPLPKTQEQIEDAIPVNRKVNTTTIAKETAFAKEAYAQYDKEADSLHSANKMRLDSIMKALNIKVPVVINPTDFIDVYVNGGGALTDGNAKQYDRISILHTGIIQREYKTKNDGVQRTEKKISKDELTKLAQYIVDMGFLDFNKEYDCADEDAACNQRFSKSPQLVPLEITLTAGQRKNKVKVAIYAPKVEKNLVHYPPTLEKIMNAIYTIVEK